MVRFKTVKYKHYRKARALMLRENNGEDVEEEYLSYAISMVAEWDFVDAETGKELPVSTKSIDEISLNQIIEISTLFNQQFGDMAATVPKATAEPSHSTSTPLSQEESPEETSPTGYQPLYSPESSE
ncbi:MAG: hypothetical protein HWN68_19220 [Desulfobacterales bacterium]|nr:hypothetical protein [Desulfobacterales bacterium]